MGEELGNLVYLVEAGGELVWEEHEGRLGLDEVEQGLGLGLVQPGIPNSLLAR